MAEIEEISEKLVHGQYIPFHGKKKPDMAGIGGRAC